MGIPPDLFAKLWASSIPTRQLAEKMGVSRSGLARHAKRVGLPPRPRGKMDRETFTKLWNAGVLASDIAKAAGYSCEQVVYMRRQRYGLPRREFATGGRCGWVNTISLREYQEQQLAELMKAAAA
jgi:hypothetical protein